jgi:hypothetical protein
VIRNIFQILRQRGSPDNFNFKSRRNTTQPLTSRNVEVTRHRLILQTKMNYPHKLRFNFLYCTVIHSHLADNRVGLNQLNYHRMTSDLWSVISTSTTWLPGAVSITDVDDILVAYSDTKTYRSSPISSDSDDFTVLQS